MPKTSTPEQTTKSNRARAVHQPFSWIDDAARDYPMADFFALTLDVCNGVHTCLEIVNSSGLVCPSDDDAASEEEVPAVTVVDAEHLLRLSIAVVTLLRQSAEQEISWINEHGVAHLQGLKDSAE